MSSEHQFKVGDKVRVKSTAYTETMKIAGKTGTVVNADSPLHIKVNIDGEDEPYGLFFSSLEPFTLDLSTTVTPDNITMIADDLYFKPKKCVKGHINDIAISAVYGAEFKPPLCPKCFAEFLTVALKDVGRIVEDE